MSPLFSSGYIESPTIRSPPSHLGISVVSMTSTIDWLYWSANSGTRPATASMSYIGICWRSIRRSVRNLKTLSTVTSATFFSKLSSPVGYSGFVWLFRSFGNPTFSPTNFPTFSLYGFSGVFVAKISPRPVLPDNLI